MRSHNRVSIGLSWALPLGSANKVKSVSRGLRSKREVNKYTDRPATSSADQNHGEDQVYRCARATLTEDQVTQQQKCFLRVLEARSLRSLWCQWGCFLLGPDLGFYYGWPSFPVSFRVLVL